MCPGLSIVCCIMQTLAYKMQKISTERKSCCHDISMLNNDVVMAVHHDVENN